MDNPIYYLRLRFSDHKTSRTLTKDDRLAIDAAIREYDKLVELNKQFIAKYGSPNSPPAKLNRVRACVDKLLGISND